MSSQQHEQAFQSHIGYQFTDVTLLRRALTHGSFGDGKVVADNERMEFLGDRVLGLIVAKYLFSDDAKSSEGQMARKLNMLVRKEACAKAARAAEIGAALYISKAEERQGGRDKNSILGDACEAVLAALYLDGGMPVAKVFFDRFWADQIQALSGPTQDPKSQLQEWALANHHGLPEYDLVSKSGPDHRPEFHIVVRVAKQSAKGHAHSKQNAERNAAQNLLQCLEQ